MKESPPGLHSIDPPQVHWKAVASLACGAIALLICSRYWERVCAQLGLPVWAFCVLLLALAAIYLGHRSLQDIRRGPAQLSGRALALAGLTLSYFLLFGGSFGFMLPLFLQSRRASAECAAVSNLRTIVRAEAAYSSQGRGYAGYADLNAARLLEPRFTVPYQAYQFNVEGYEFSVVADSSGYTASAAPVSRNTGSYGYYAATDGVVRYSTAMTLAPPGMSGRPVE